MQCKQRKGKAKTDTKEAYKNKCKTRHCTITKGNARKGKSGKAMKCNMRQRRLEQIKVNTR